VLVIYQGLRPALRNLPMDYLVGGFAALLLFGYLIYALLKAEKF
jgi:K+-transporting ATPase KdpF subunit